MGHSNSRRVSDWLAGLELGKNMIGKLMTKRLRKRVYVDRLNGQSVKMFVAHVIPKSNLNIG